MQSKRVVNQIFFGSVAFGVSFGIGLLANRDLNKALLTGAITIPATYAGAVITDKRRTNQEKLLRGSLRNQVQELEQQQIKLHQTLSAKTAELQKKETNRNFLQTELGQLQNQIAEQLHLKEGLNQDITALQEQKHQLEERSHNLHTQVQALEKKQTTLNQSLAAKTAEIQKTQTNLNSLQAELERLRTQVVEQQNGKEALTHELTTLRAQKQQLVKDRQQLESRLDSLHTELEQLQNQFPQRQNNKRQLDQELSTLQEQRKQVEAEKNKLQAQIQTLETEQTQWNQLISLTKAESQKAEANLKSLQAELSNLQLQVTKLQNENEIPDQEQINQEEQKQEDNGELPSEWEEFMWELSEYEIQILKSIAEEDNPIETIKRISEEQIKMPELLIESINERALETVGDLIIESGTSPPMIADEDYLTILKQMLKVYEDLAK